VTASATTGEWYVSEFEGRFDEETLLRRADPEPAP